MTMRRRMVVWTVVAALLVLVQSASAAPESDLDRAGLKAEAQQNKALARYLRYNGYPDVARVRPILDQPPWDDHEVTLYYFGSHKEICFARARVLGKPEIHTTRYQRTLTDADIRSLGTHARSGGGEMVASATTCTGNATARAECSATRAEHAADRVDAAAGKAEHAAERTEAVVAKMEASQKTARPHRSSKKH
jgi:hypothetical protein